MSLFVAAMVLLVFSGVAALLVKKHATVIGVGGGLVAYVLAAVPAVGVIMGGESVSFSAPWNIPYASFTIEIDPLSAFFLLPVIFLCALASVYGSEYMQVHRGKSSLGVSWFFFNLLSVGMMLVTVARNGVLFLFAWELMTVASFFLVTFEDEHEEHRKAGRIYLIASHIGTIFLIFLFILLGSGFGSLDFGFFKAAPGMADIIFLLAIIGFGTKAGFIPFHVWLPEAHPAAPSHVSAVMSGVMIKTGIYGLVRTLSFLGTPPEWWGWFLIAVGVTSGVLGVIFALAQHDLKRLLAYHSVENIGIIALGLGVGLLGMSHGSLLLTILGFGGGLLHVINHACFKGLLFLGAGSVLHATGTREMDRLGGLIKKMPITTITFLIGAAAISGLPPLNGFVSEFMIYFGAFKGVSTMGAPDAVPLLGVIGGLALIGGLAVACFTKAFGVVFLGEPRTEYCNKAHDPGMAMRLPMVLLAAACIGISLASPWLFNLMIPVVGCVYPVTEGLLGNELDAVSSSLMLVMLTALILAAVVIVLALYRRYLLSDKQVGKTGTWDCGYAKPEPQMQYTSSSYAQPLVDMFHWILRTKRHQKLPSGLFSKKSEFESHTHDTFHNYLYKPVFFAINKGFAFLRFLQHGRVQLYILYILITLVVLFFLFMD